jgi:hypothetical protein
MCCIYIYTVYINVSNNLVVLGQTGFYEYDYIHRGKVIIDLFLFIYKYIYSIYITITVDSTVDLWWS